MLDVATGAGNTALAAARRGCRVTAIDFVPALLERGRERAAAERLPVDFREGEADKIPCPGASFDAVLSTFGAMFAPDPQTPEGMIGEMFQIVRAAAPPAVDPAPPEDWGLEAKLRERFGDRISTLAVTRPLGCVSAFHANATIVTFRALSPERREALTAAMVELAARYNQSGDQTLLARGEYVEVVAIKR